MNEKELTERLIKIIDEIREMVVDEAFHEEIENYIEYEMRTIYKTVM